MAPANATPAPLTLSTSHYHIYTDLEAPLAIDLARRMDAMFDEYSQRFAGVADLRRSPPLEVYLFRNRCDYLRLVGPEFQNTAGLFVPDRQFLGAFLEGQGRDALRRTLQHEAFHQFAYEALGEDLPPWLNEGLAQIFEEALWTGSDFLLFQVPPRRVRQLQADLRAGKLMALSDLIQLDAEQWSAAYTGNPSIGMTRYNQAWALVYFLAHERDASGAPYLPTLLEYLHQVHSAGRGTDSLSPALPDVHVLEPQFLIFCRTLQPTPEAALIERQQVLADLLSQLAARGSFPSDLAAARRALYRGGYRLHYSKGELRWDSDPDPRLYFTDLTGRPFDSRHLFFDRSGPADIPDLICRWSPGVQLRTRFDRSNDRIEHETVLEPIAKTR